MATGKMITGIGGSYYHKLLKNTGNSFYFQLTDANIYELKVEGNIVKASVVKNAGKLEPFIKYNNIIAGYVAPDKVGFFNGKELYTYKVLNDNLRVTSMTVTTNNIYFIGTSAGLYKVAAEGKLLKVYNQSSGLANDNIFSVIADNNNNIWCGHYKGISKIDAADNITNFSPKDGLQDFEFNTNAVAKTNNGELFFGGGGGINSFYPQSLSLTNEAPEIKITSIKAGNQFTDTDTAFWNFDEVQVNYTNNSINLSFNALGKQQTAVYNYQYRFSNNEANNWINLQQNNNIYFTLQPGTYYIDLYAGRAFNKNASPLKTLKIIITPPIWKRWYFLIGYLFISIVSLVYFIQFLNKRKYRKQLAALKLKQQLEEERQRISRDLHDSMGAYTSALLSNVQQLKNQILLKNRSCRKCKTTQNRF